MTAPLPTEIRTERLLVRPIEDDDAPAIRRYAGDERIARYTATVPHPYPEDGVEQFLARWRPKERADTGRVFAICLSEDGLDLIGVISLDEYEDGALEIGYWLGVPFWGRGLMSEAAAAMAEFGRRWRPGVTIVANTFPENVASQRVLEKAGFRRDGVAVCEAPARDCKRVENAARFVFEPVGPA